MGGCCKGGELGEYLEGDTSACWACLKEVRNDIKDRVRRDMLQRLCTLNRSVLIRKISIIDEETIKCTLPTHTSTAQEVGLPAAELLNYFLATLLLELNQALDETLLLTSWSQRRQLLN